MDHLTLLQQTRLPFADLLGIRYLSADLERVTAELVVRDDLCTRPAVLHGGALMAFADTVGACAAYLNLPEGAATTTLESKTNFLAPAPVGTTVIAECTRCIAESAPWSGRLAFLPGTGACLLW